MFKLMGKKTEFYANTISLSASMDLISKSRLSNIFLIYEPNHHKLNTGSIYPVAEELLNQHCNCIKQPTLSVCGRI